MIKIFLQDSIVSKNVLNGTKGGGGVRVGGWGREVIKTRLVSKMAMTHSFPVNPTDS